MGYALSAMKLRYIAIQLVIAAILFAMDLTRQFCVMFARTGVHVMGRYISEKAMCPWYKDETGSSIFCDASNISLSTAIHFTGKRDEIYDWKRKYCYGEHDRCPIAKFLNEKPE